MQSKSDLHYRWKDDELIVKKTNGRRQVFPRARDVYRNGEDVMVVTALGHIVRVDKYGNKHW